MPSWADLNKRQQTYLQAVFEVDQAQEDLIKWLGSQDHYVSTPASEWRWMLYNASGVALLRKVQDAGYRNEGTGSTFAALERRGFILCKYEPGSLGGPILFVQSTKAGRKLVRDALNIQAPKTLPVSTLREWHWRALCRAYVRGEQGMGYDSDTCDGFGYVSWKSCLRLRDYQVKGHDRALIREGRRSEQFALIITDFGRVYYCENWQRYRDLYPMWMRLNLEAMNKSCITLIEGFMIVPVLIGSLIRP